MITTDAKSEDVAVTFGEPEDIYDEKLPGYTEIEPNAVTDNTKQSTHYRSYCITTFVWISIFGFVLFMIIGVIAFVSDASSAGVYFSIMGGCAGGILVCCGLNFCEYRCCSSTYQYLTNFYDSQNGLIGYIGMFVISLLCITIFLYLYNNNIY